MFENYAEEALSIEREIVRRGVALDIDWEDEAAVRELAREALSYRPGADGKVSHSDTTRWRTKVELFGLAELMLKVMKDSAEEDIETHGGPVWKAFGRALWRESGLGD